MVGCSSPKQSTLTSMEAEATGESDALISTEADTNENAFSRKATDNSTNSSEHSSLYASNVPDELDEAIAQAVIDNNKGMYLEGECGAEGHIVMDTEDVKSSVIVYALTSYGEYSFENGMFIKMSGSGVIPVVINFATDKSGAYLLQSYTQPSDGSDYTASIKKLFPKALYNRIVPTSDSDRTALLVQEKAYASDYLKSIGREAQIGEFSDLNIELADIPDEVYNTVFDRYWEYPYWIGTEERIEDGVRYVYETQWKDYGNDSGLIYLTKYIYDTGKIVRTINIHIDDGKVSLTEEKVLSLNDSAYIEE